MKKTLKEEMLEAIEEVYGTTSNIRSKRLATSCTSIAEKHIKIARLEGMIEGLEEGCPTEERIAELEQELEQLKKQ